MLLVFAGSGFAVETGVAEAAEDFADLWSRGKADREEVIAREVRTLEAGFGEVVEEALADGWLSSEGAEGPEGREWEWREHFRNGAAFE